MESRNGRQVSRSRLESRDPEVVLARLRRRGADAKREEVETAVEKLEASRDLSERERAVLEDMADRIVDELLAAPTAALEEATRREDPPTTPLARLFDPGD